MSNIYEEKMGFFLKISQFLLLGNEFSIFPVTFAKKYRKNNTNAEGGRNMTAITRILMLTVLLVLGSVVIGTILSQTSQAEDPSYRFSFESTPRSSMMNNQSTKAPITGKH